MPLYDEGEYADLLGNMTSGGGWGKVSDALGSAGKSIGGGTFTSIGSMFGPWGTAVGGALDLVPTITGLFKPSVEGQQKIDATKQQQMLEKSVADIQSRVDSGSLSPVTALQMLKNLYAQASAYGGNVYDQRGMQTVLATINGVMGNVREKYINSLGMSPEVYNQAKDSGQGLSTIYKDPNQQQDAIKQALRDKMMGMGNADNTLKGTPMEKLFKPAFDVNANLDSTMNKVKGIVPDYKEPTAFNSIRKKLEGGI